MEEEKQIAIQNLEKYIKEDTIYNGSRENLSDFDEFCINHCLDIQIVLELVKEQQKEIETLQRDKKIVLEKLGKVINGLENDFPITLGEQQPLWEENKPKYVSKDKIRAVVEKIDAYYRMAKAGIEESQKEGYAYNPLDTGRAEAHNADREFVKELLEE